MVLITALFPSADVLPGKMVAEGLELLNYFTIREAVIEHLVDLLADFFGQAGDVAVALAAGGGSVGVWVVPMGRGGVDMFFGFHMSGEFMIYDLYDL